MKQNHAKEFLSLFYITKIIIATIISSTSSTELLFENVKNADQGFYRQKSVEKDGGHSYAISAIKIHHPFIASFRFWSWEPNDINLPDEEWKFF